MNDDAKKKLVRIVTETGNSINFGKGVKVIDVATGQQIDGVRDVQISIPVDDIVTATVTLAPAAVDIVADAELVTPTIDTSACGSSAYNVRFANYEHARCVSEDGCFTAYVREVVKDWNGNVISVGPEVVGYRYAATQPKPHWFWRWPGTLLVAAVTGFTCGLIGLPVLCVVAPTVVCVHGYASMKAAKRRA